MRFLFELHDPLHRLIISLVVSALTVIFQGGDGYHWIKPPDDNPLETHPKIKIR